MKTIGNWRQACGDVRARTVTFVHEAAKYTLSVVVATTMTLTVTPVIAADAFVQVYPVKDSFANVRDEVADAIVKRGLVIDYTAHIGTMLARTAKDVGASKTIFANAEALQFCSATLSRRTMEADPANIAFCPYVVFVYALPGAPDTTYVGYRPLPRVGSEQSKASIDAVNALLDGIAREAANKK